MKINVANRWAVTTSVALLAAGTIVATASPAQAAYWPHRGDLCQAVENIQFYADDFSTPSYVVQTNEYIRIDIDGETLVDWTQGHGDGHSSRNFIYRQACRLVRGAAPRIGRRSSTTPAPGLPKVVR